MTDAEKLFEKVKTRQLGEEIVEALQALASSRSSKKNLPADLSYKLESLGKVGNYGQLLEDFERLFYGTTTVVLTLSFYPTDPVLSKIINWFEDNVGEKVIIDLVVDPEIVGGAKVMCNEHFRDYSVRAKLEEMGVLSSPVNAEQKVSAII
ncbi:F0F1 ATP synthase subunit delta [Candidatus Curtissbacteria bacterium]|nr:F0F1 ATP synthase subunit delta [Candidatus Curtissbacteria bacterium]